jgi:hypothetical protein
MIDERLSIILSERILETSPKNWEKRFIFNVDFVTEQSTAHYNLYTIQTNF